MLKHQPKTLAKTLDYIARRSPGEYGLFWDPDGAMPWKEFYWALQEDPSLRFVRESTIRELELLGIELPFVMDGNRLRLVAQQTRPCYPPAFEVPERLFFGLRAKNLVHVQKNGLYGHGNRSLALCEDRELALRIAKRREEAPILVEILAREASLNSLSFFVAGPQLYLTEFVPVTFIVFPKIRRDVAEKMAEHAPKREVKPSPVTTPGSFTVQPQHLQTSQPAGKTSKNDARAGWKKDSRKERHKRDV
jgi:putative RNA 2'-phosphotransferase